MEPLVSANTYKLRSDNGIATQKVLDIEVLQGGMDIVNVRASSTSIITLQPDTNFSHHFLIPLLMRSRNKPGDDRQVDEASSTEVNTAHTSSSQLIYPEGDAEWKRSTLASQDTSRPSDDKRDKRDASKTKPQPQPNPTVKDNDGSAQNQKINSRRSKRKRQDMEEDDMCKSDIRMSKHARHST